MPAFKGRQRSCSPEGAAAQKYPRKKPPSATWGVEPLRISCSEALYDSTLDSEIKCDAYHFPGSGHFGYKSSRVNPCLFLICTKHFVQNVTIQAKKNT